MAKDPAFLFYSQDFIVGVQTMTFEDRGKYISILCQMHQQGRLDEETIRFLVGSVSDKLRLKFKVDDKGLWYNERLELETARRNEFTESRRLNGKQGGRPKKQKPNGEPKQNHKDMHMGNHMGNENESVIVNRINTKESFSKIDLFDELFNDQIYVGDLAAAHKGKSLNQAFEECWIYWNNSKSPPDSIGEWKQKLNTWLSNTKTNGHSKNGKQSTRDLAAALQERINQDAAGKQSGGSS